MSWSLVGDVADVVRIETLRSAPLVVDVFTKAIPAFDRTFGLRPRLIGLAPAEFLPQSDHRPGALSDFTYAISARNCSSVTLPAKVGMTGATPAATVTEGFRIDSRT